MAEETAKEEAWLLKAHVLSEEKWLDLGAKQGVLGNTYWKGVWKAVYWRVSTARQRGLRGVWQVSEPLFTGSCWGRKVTRWKHCCRRLSWWGSERWPTAQRRKRERLVTKSVTPRIRKMWGGAGGRVSVCLGCHNKIPQTECLKNDRNFYLSGDGKCERPLLLACTQLSSCRVLVWPFLLVLWEHKSHHGPRPHDLI